MSTWSRLVFLGETLDIPSVHSVGQYHYVAARAALPPRQHPGCVIINLLVKGHQVHQFGEETYHVKGGDQYLSLPEEGHGAGTEPQDKGILYWLILDVTKDRNKFLFLAPAMARKLVSDLLQMPSRHFAADPGAQATLDRVFQSLLHVRKPDECTGIFRKNGGPTPSFARGEKSAQVSFSDSFHLLAAANQIVSYLLQTVTASRAKARLVSPVIQASLDFIAKNEAAWLNVGHVAEEVHLSESYFKILFREEVGLPPAEYMLRQKIDAAKALLCKPGCNITDLAYRLGFSSSQYFATVFKRFTNQTPSEFMNRSRPPLIHVAA